MNEEIYEDSYSKYKIVKKKDFVKSSDKMGFFDNIEFEIKNINIKI